MGVNRYVQISEEQTFGVKSTATAPVFVLDPEVADLDVGGEDKAVWNGISRQDRHAVLAPFSIAGNINNLADLEAATLFWKLALGSAGYSVAGAGPTYDHTFVPDIGNLRESFSCLIGKDDIQDTFLGCVVNTLQIAVTDNFVRMVLGILGASNVKETLQSPAPAFTEGAIYAPHDVAMSLNAVDASAKVENFTMDVNNQLSIDAGRSIGSRFPRRVFNNGILVTANIQLAFIDQAELTRFWGQASGPLATGVPTDVPIVISIGSAYDITLPRGIYMNLGKPMAGRDRIVQNASVRFLASTDGSEDVMQVDISNTVETYVPTFP